MQAYITLHINTRIHQACNVEQLYTCMYLCNVSTYFHIQTFMHAHERVFECLLFTRRHTQAHTTHSSSVCVCVFRSLRWSAGMLMQAPTLHPNFAVNVLKQPRQKAHALTKLKCPRSTY